MGPLSRMALGSPGGLMLMYFSPSRVISPYSSSAALTSSRLLMEPAITSSSSIFVNSTLALSLSPRFSLRRAAFNFSSWFGSDTSFFLSGSSGSGPAAFIVQRVAPGDEMRLPVGGRDVQRLPCFKIDPGREDVDVNFSVRFVMSDCGTRCSGPFPVRPKQRLRSCRVSCRFSSGVGLSSFAQAITPDVYLFLNSRESAIRATSSGSPRRT